MDWLNIYGLIFMAVIMVPNMVFAAKNKNGFQNLWHNKAVEALEQIGRYGCFVLMIFILPGCGFGFSSHAVLILYLLVNTLLVGAYCLIWILCSKQSSVFRALALSILPSAVFLFSGAISRYWPLLAAAVIFAPCHICISYRNAVPPKEGPNSSLK